MNKTWYSVAEVSERFSVSQSTIRRLIADTYLPALRVGQQLRIHTDTLEHFQDAGLMSGLDTLEGDDLKSGSETLE